MAELDLAQLGRKQQRDKKNRRSLRLPGIAHPSALRGFRFRADRLLSPLVFIATQLSNVGSTLVGGRTAGLHKPNPDSPPPTFISGRVGSRIRLRLYNGKVVEAEITAITNQSAGREVQIVYGVVTASINPAQITEVQPTR